MPGRVMIYPTHLSCGHVAHFTPEPQRGEVVFCRRCDDYWTVTLVEPGEGKANDRYQTVISSGGEDW